jgi:hypothetical protein
MSNREMAALIDEAVHAWHEVARDHGTRPCNCFREEFARRLIKQGKFCGYDKLDVYGDDETGPVLDLVN